MTFVCGTLEGERKLSLLLQHFICVNVIQIPSHLHNEITLYSSSLRTHDGCHTVEQQCVLFSHTSSNFLHQGVNLQTFSTNCKFTLNSHTVSKLQTQIINDVYSYL